MESSLPESLTSTPLAPVAFVGLDIPNITKTSGRHTTIWHAFTAERSPDRVPLKVLHTNNLKQREMGGNFLDKKCTKMKFAFYHKDNEIKAIFSKITENLSNFSTFVFFYIVN